MEPRVLVAYATKHGATEEIADKIGEVIRSAGPVVDVLPADGVSDLTPYQAVVLGSSVYVGQWRRQAVKFLKANEGKLSELPVWIFSSGPTGEGDPVELLKGWRFPEGQQSLADRIQPREIVVFHGAIDPKKLGFVEQRMIKMVKASLGDFRQWDTIVAWAVSIAAAVLSKG